MHCVRRATGLALRTAGSIMATSTTPIARTVSPLTMRESHFLDFGMAARTSPQDRHLGAAAEFSAPHIGHGLLSATAETLAAFGFIPSSSAFRRARKGNKNP